MPPLLAPGGVGNQQQPSRAASAVAAKPARGFQIFRIDGYSWAKTLPAGECITSDSFVVGGRTWQVDYYPNGTDSSKPDSDAISLYLRLVSSVAAGNRHGKLTGRVRAQFKFSLLDLAGSQAFELPAETGVFRPPNTARSRSMPFSPAEVQEDAPDLGCGNAAFITKEELERRGQSLLADDCLAVRCDVGVMHLQDVAVGPNKRKAIAMRVRGRGGMPVYGRHAYGRGYAGGDDDYYSSEDEEDGEGGGRRQQPQLDDGEFIRQCLPQRRRT